jgi:hypothetical protein
MTKIASTLVALALAAAAGAASAEGPVDTQSIALAGAPSQVDRATVVAEVQQARRAGTLALNDVELNQWNLPATSTASRVAVKSEAARATASGEIRAVYGEVNTLDSLPVLRARGEVVARR